MNGGEPDAARNGTAPRGRKLVSALPLQPEHEAVEDWQKVPGAPEATTATVPLVAPEAFGEVSIGVWEMSAGSMRDEEAEEVFIVLTGSARIEGEGWSLDVTAGDVVHLEAGAQTVWTVHSPLRKVYLIAP